MREEIRKAIELVGKPRKNPRGNGYLRLESGGWFGYFWHKSPLGKRVRHCKRLGSSHEINEQQARMLLCGAIRQHAVSVVAKGGKSGAIRARWADPARLPPTVAGSIYEHLVIADMLTRGFEVFHATFPTASCDLVCIKDADVFRVQVRSGRRVGDKIACCAGRGLGKYDLLVIVTPDWNVEYLSASEVRSSVVYVSPEATIVDYFGGDLAGEA